MAKDVDLSSREWLDLVFEGKNKDFGAYQIRNDSARRHNKSVLYTIIGIVAVAAIAFAYTSINKYLTEKRLQEELLKQQQIEAKAALEEKEEEQQEIELPPEKEKVPEEEIQSSQKVTELNVVEDKEVKEIVKTNEEVLENKEMVGSQDVKTDNQFNLDDARTLKQEEVIAPPEPPKKEEPKPEAKPEPKPESNEVFKSAATMPSYPGGSGALMKYISSHIHYPQSAQDNNISGKVIVQFVVEKDGSIGEVKVVRGVDKALDAEAKRVCKSLPKFSPGKNANGDPVRVWFTQPVTFKLQGAN